MALQLVDTQGSRFEAKLQGNEPGVEAHLHACQTLEVMATFACFNLPDVASAEILSRTIQTNEDRYRARMPGAVDTSDQAQEASMMPGLDQVRGNVCMAPALSDWLSSELQKEVVVLTEHRNAREERAAAKPKKDPRKPPADEK